MHYQLQMHKLHLFGHSEGQEIRISHEICMFFQIITANVLLTKR